MPRTSDESDETKPHHHHPTPHTTVSQPQQQQQQKNRPYTIHHPTSNIQIQYTKAIKTMIWKLLSYLLRMWTWKWFHIITVMPFIPVVSSFDTVPRSISTTSTSTSTFRVIHPHPYHHNRLHRTSSSRFVSLPGFRPTGWLLFLVNVDPYRDQNQIRPSLHPITINIIAQALKLRASAQVSTASNNNNPSQPPSHNRTTTTTAAVTDRVVWPTQPLDVVLTVSALAQTALAQRQHRSREDQMILTLPEQQTIAGRVVGVMVRIQYFEQTLIQKCINVPYIWKYNEWHTYGLVRPDENDTNDARPQQQQQQVQLSFGNNNNNNNDNIDPLLLLNRAECCLALFIQTVEIPELQRKNATVPDESRIDFLDADRYQVLVSSSSS